MDHVRALAAVRIVELEPMRVASTYGFGDSPEEAAWQEMYAWANPRGLLDDLDVHRLFGFNNPYPTPELPKYGYEMWIEVGADAEPAERVRIVEFFGGEYAVCRCEVAGRPEVNVPAAWQALSRWCTSHGKEPGRHPALERFLSPPTDLQRLVLELHCPIRT